MSKIKIYTKTGDKGETGLFGGGRVRKDHPRIAAYGDVDELNAMIGRARGLNDTPDPFSIDPILKKIQNDLFDLGALLATPHKERLQGKATGFIRKEDISFLEQEIDRLDHELPPLRNFILPGGSDLASILHFARTVCRRAGGGVVAPAGKEPVEEEVLSYINRLSDFLFVLARWVNHKKGVVETIWEKK